MPSARSLAATASVLLAAVLAVIAFAPPAVTAAPAAKIRVTWHVLKLSGGYVNGDQAGQRAPGYGTNGTGIVYLAGEVCEKPPLKKEYFAVIPQALRPAHDLILPASTGNVTQPPALMTVARTGWLEMQSRCLDLAGISYPAGE